MATFPRYNEGRAIPTTQKLGGVASATRAFAGIEVDTRQLQAAQKVPTIDPRGFEIEAGAGAKLGEGIADLGSATAKIAMKQLEHIGIAKEAEADAAMIEAEGEIAVALEKEPDETKWRGIADGIIAKTGSKIFTGPLSPMAETAITQKYSRWKFHRSGQTTLESAKQSRRKAGAAVEAKMLYAADAGDTATVDKLADDAVATGLLGEDAAARAKIGAKNYAERKAEKEKSERRGTQSEAFLGMAMTNPVEAREVAKKLIPGSPEAQQYVPDLDASDILRLQSAVREMADRQEHDNFEQIRNDITGEVVGGELPHEPAGGVGPMPVPPSEAEIDSQVKDGKIDAYLGHQLKEFRSKLAEEKARGAPMDWSKAAELQTEIENFNPGKFKTEDEAIKQWSSLSMRADLLSASGGDEGKLTGGVWRNRLYQNHPYQNKQPQGPESDAKKLFDEELTIRKNEGTWGQPTVQVKKTKKVIDPDTGEETQRDYFDEVPNGVMMQRFATAHYDLWRLFQQDFARNPQDLDESHEISAWVGAKTLNVVGGQRAAIWSNQGRPRPAAPSQRAAPPASTVPPTKETEPPPGPSSPFIPRGMLEPGKTGAEGELPFREAGELTPEQQARLEQLLPPL